MKLVKNYFGRKVKFLKSDNRTEIINTDIRGLLENLKAFHSKSNAYKPQKNGNIEREMGTIIEAMQKILHAEDLEMSLRARVINSV